MFEQLVDEIGSTSADVQRQIAEAMARVNCAVDAGTVPVGVRLCVGLGVLERAFADMPPDAREEVRYRLVGVFLGADPVAGEAGGKLGFITAARDGPLAA